MEYNPETNFHYLHVINDNLVFRDVYLSYKNAAARIPWMSVITQDEFRQICSQPRHGVWSDKRIYLILWHDDLCLIPNTNHCKVAIHYCEMVGDVRAFPPQQKIFDKFLAYISKYEFVMVHTKFAEEYLRKYCPRIYYVPIGFDPQVYGIPDFNIKKTRDMVFFGSDVGKRLEIVPKLQETFSSLRINVFGMERQNLMQTAKLNLIIPWCEVGSFAPMRMWQSMGTSAVMVIEPTDTYPAIPDRHYIQIPKYAGDLSESIKAIKRALDTDLLKIARTAFEELSVITVDKCIGLIVELSERRFL